MALGADDRGKPKIWRKWGVGGVALAIGFALFIMTHIDTPAPYVEWKIPEHPVAKAAYDYAHSIMLPDSVPKPVPFKFCRYNVLGLCFGKATDEEYFEHLCKTEAGEYVFKRVEGVEGIAEVRPRRRAMTDGEALDRYALEDPLTWAADGAFTPVIQESLGKSFVQPPLGKYRFYDYFAFDQVEPSLIHFFREPNADPEGKRTMTRLNLPPVKWVLSSRVVERSQAKHYIVFRGVRRDRDREFAVAGSELILLEEGNPQPIAVRRDFAKSPEFPRVDWDRARSCLKTFDATARRFVTSVLVPNEDR